MEKTIDISELRQITELIFDHILNTLEIKSVELTKDMYWSIFPNDLYNIEQEPKEMGIGQLFDDIDFLSNILDDKSQAVPPMLMHLAPVLQFLSTQVNWYKFNN